MLPVSSRVSVDRAARFIRARWNLAAAQRPAIGFFPAALTAHRLRFSARPCGPLRPWWDACPPGAASQSPHRVPHGSPCGFLGDSPRLFPCDLGALFGVSLCAVGLVPEFGHGSPLGRGFVDGFALASGMAPPWFPRQVRQWVFLNVSSGAGSFRPASWVWCLVSRSRASHPARRRCFGVFSSQTLGAASLRAAGAGGVPLCGRSPFGPWGPCGGPWGIVSARVAGWSDYARLAVLGAHGAVSGAVLMRPKAVTRCASRSNLRPPS